MFGLMRLLRKTRPARQRAVANLGAIALENVRLYESVQKDYEVFRRDMLEWRAALGDEWMIGESVIPTEE